MHEWPGGYSAATLPEAAVRRSRSRRMNITPAQTFVTLGVSRCLVTVLVAASAAGFAGCAGDDAKQPRSNPPATVSPTPTGKGEDDAARDASLAAYNGYREAYVKAAE